MKIVRLKTTDEKKILTILDRGRGVLSLVSIVVEAVSSLELRSLNQILRAQPSQSEQRLAIERTNCQERKD